MRTLIFLMLISVTANAQMSRGEVGGMNYKMPILDLKKSIQDGWYSATVSYSNSNTYTRSTYTLDVEVESDRVVTISFGQGRSVHDGYNNSGYTYSGGYLSFQSNYQGGISAATTQVTIYKGNSIITYDVRIE